MKKLTFEKTLLTTVCLGLVVSAIEPHDYFTWFLEVVPIFIGVPILVWLAPRRFCFTQLTYFWIAIHCLILMIGAHYTYALVPIGEWAKETFQFSRNHYDRIGHIFQGFVPALIVREVGIRKMGVRHRGWLFFIVTCVCLAVSAVYEMLEWLTAILSKEAADSFLGTQGDNWDTQWDMFLALLGAIASQLIFSKWQDKKMEEQRLETRNYSYNIDVL